MLHAVFFAFGKLVSKAGRILRYERRDGRSHECFQELSRPGAEISKDKKTQITKNARIS